MKRKMNDDTWDQADEIGNKLLRHTYSLWVCSIDDRFNIKSFDAVNQLKLIIIYNENLTRHNPHEEEKNSRK